MSAPAAGSDEEAELAEALLRSAADADPELAAALRESAAPHQRAASAAPSPNARVDVATGGIILLLAGVSEAEDLVFEDLTRIRAGAWARGAGGSVEVVAPAAAGGRAAPGSELPAEDATVKWCSLCPAKMDGRRSRNAWTWRCAPCRVDLCTLCFEGGAQRPCAHEYAALPPGGPAGGMPRAPPPPGFPGSRP